MVKKSAVILGILAVLVVGAGMSWGYTVSQWPVPGIPNTVFRASGSCLVGPEDTMLKGPVAPGCEAPLVPGLIHGVLSVPMKAVALVTTPLMAGSLTAGPACCPVDLGDPAYVVAAVPCTPVNAYVPMKSGGCQ